jgi:hypothetical protein
MIREKQITQERRPALKLWETSSSFLGTALSLPFASAFLIILILFPLVETVTHVSEASADAATNHESAGNYIRETIPNRYQNRYQRWKQEYLSTKAGREQWDRYARNRNFTLTITVSEERGAGAGTDQYRWDESGQLIAAVITLGARIDEGYPSPVNYPVTSALAHTEPYPTISGSILAATKLAHEFGHVNRAAETDAQLFQLQNKLIPIYNRLLLSNGANVHDPRLVELAKQMKGTPVKIGQDRELWAEANALIYLRERCPDDETHRPMFKAIQRAVAEYAKEHIERFR